uniref:Coiled-coil and C2 domain-containing protein 2A n=1 Tax=Phallusia mammillata TaxID=59560 RepID=A0A6F9D8Z7_9ASCI|nr:coiled-coil and C2 domain-containing protein 2A [Phallusia mammillata]
MAEPLLKEKLRARRRAMNITAQSDINNEAVSSVDDTLTQNLAEHLEEVESEEDGNRLRSLMESRREASKRKLDAEEQEESQANVGDSEEYVDDILSTPRTPLPSRGPSRGPASPRTDTESRSSTPFGKATPRSTLRSRLQAKIQKNKMTGTSTSEEFKPRTRRLRDRMQLSTRFDETVKTESLIKETQLLERIESKLKWKQAAEKARQETGQPTETDCFDFFTKQYEDVEIVEPKPAEPVEPPHPPEEPDAVAEEPQEPSPDTEQPDTIEQQATETPPPTATEGGQAVPEQQKLLIEDLVPKELDYRLYDVYAAEYGGYQNQVDKENLNYFIPSMLPSDISKKVEDSARPRYLEDEGFYVGRKPEIGLQNKNILENRLLRQPDNGRGWFGADGEIEILPDPIKQVATKPWVEAVEEVDPSIETVYVKAYEYLVEGKYLQGSEENELQVDIGTVIYHHHALMSREHVMASNLSQCYDEYIQKRHKNYVNFYIDKLAALRRAVATILSSHDESLSTEVAASVRETRVHDFMSEIRRTSRQLNEAESSERDLMRRIIEEWREIKAVRDVQGFTNTSLKLTVKREEVNQQQDMQRWEDEVENQVEEKRDEYEISVIKPYQESLRKYQSQLQDWKKNRAKIKQQRKKLQRGSKENLLDSTNTETDEEITIAENVDKPQKPEKPEAFDVERVRVEIKNTLLEHRRNPGEPKLSLELAHTASVSTNATVPATESMRRKAMQKTSIVLKLLLNGKEVFQTEAKNLTSDFKLHFGSIFRIRITQWPESLKVQFLEAGLVMKTLLSEVYLTVPDTNVHSGNVQLTACNFTSERVEVFDHEAVGSNTPFKLHPTDTAPTSCNTRGQLISSVSWGLDENGKVLAPKGLTQVGADPLSVVNPMKTVDPVSAIGADRIQDPESLSKWVQDSRLDPNDPENAAFIPFMSGDQEGQGFLYAPDYFRLEQLQEEFNFLSDEEFERLNRLRLLELRDKEVAEFRNMTLIPSQEHEIMDSAFTVYERRLKEKKSLQLPTDQRPETATMSAHRLEVLRYRQLVKDAVLHRFYTARHHYTLQDMVHEQQVPDISTLGASVAKAFEPRRPLKPVKKDRKKATAQSLTQGSVNILVNIVRGYNLPVRVATHATAQEPTNTGRRFGGVESMIHLGSAPTAKTFEVNPFVAISFQDQVITTSVSEGRNPSWNEELKIPFAAPNNDFSSGSLQAVDDVIFVHLFDRTIEEASAQHEDDDPTLIVHRIQDHWLGTWKLPFSTVYHQGKVEGTFKLKVPPVLLGYSKDVQQTTDPSGQLDQQFAQQTSGTFLSLFITLDPILKPAEAPRPKFESQENETTLKMCGLFMEECTKKFPNRNVKATVVDLKGEAVLITRYVHPIQPPPELTEGSDPQSLSTAERVARYVSLIPFESDNVAYAGICDLWSTCDQFVHMLSGDEEEHAVLLLNFFLALGKKAYLLLGNAVPEGSTAYVLTVNEATRERTFWNASTGRYYDHKDNFSPLQSIGALVNDQNIWFNLQTLEKPSRTRFNLLNTSDWKPFFSSKFPNPGTLPTVQPDILHYSPADRAFVSGLTDQIERTLKERIASWRPRHVTRWNRSSNAILGQILRVLEATAARRTAGDSNQESELLNQLGDVRFTGFPMDMPYISVEQVVSAVRSTEVHKIVDPNVEFSLAVYIHPYPASVLAVWVYVAAIVNRRRHNL